MSDNYKKEIENHAKEYFGDLHISMPEEMIGKTIFLFEFHLSKEGLVDNDDYDLCHSELLEIPSSLIIDIEDLAIGIARIYGTKAIQLVKHGTDKKVTYYISYVGYKGDVHACLVSLKSY